MATITVPVPNVFVPGTLADANAVNANFTAATSLDGIYIEAYLHTADGNPSLPTFDWGVVFNRAVAGIGPGGTLLFRANWVYGFLTTGVLSGAGFDVFGAGRYSTVLKQLGNNDILQSDPTWNGVLSDFTMKGRSDQTPTAGYGMNFSHPGQCIVQNITTNLLFGVVGIGATADVGGGLPGPRGNAGGFQSIKFTNVSGDQFLGPIGWYIGGTNDPSPANVVEMTGCGANPGTVATQNASANATAFVFDGDIQTVKMTSCGGVGNSNDGSSYGGGIRFQSTYGTKGIGLITLDQCGFDHVPGISFDLGGYGALAGSNGGFIGLGNAQSPSGFLGSAQASNLNGTFPQGTAGTGALSGVELTGLKCTSTNFGIVMDNIAQVRESGSSYQPASNNVWIGANASKIRFTGTSCRVGSDVCVWLQSGAVGIEWVGGHIGEMSGTSNGAGTCVRIGAACDYITFKSVVMRGFSNPVVMTTSTASQVWNQIRFIDCDGFTPQYGSAFTPSSAAGTYFNCQGYPVQINTTIAATTTAYALTVVPAPGEPGSQIVYTPSNGTVQMSHSVPVPVGAKVILSFGGTQPAWVWIGM